MLERRLLLSSYTLNTLYSFTGSGDGASPTAGVIVSGSTLYGTANIGAYSGVVFSLPTSGGTPTVLASSGATPSGASLILSDGILYGTTSNGGANGDGDVYSVPVTGGTPTVLASFDGANGNKPEGGLILSDGILYGTTTNGGAYGDGEVYSVPIAGGAPTVLASFNGTDGANPIIAGVILSGGTLYGTTESGGAYGDGEVFSLPAAGGTPTVLASFNGMNGLAPSGSLILSGSTLYGMTTGGGSGEGNVFSLPITGGTPTSLASFDSTTGEAPYGGSLLLSGSTLYGTTQVGGTVGGGGGTVFSLPVAGGTPTVRAAFTATTGDMSFATLVADAAGNLYGTTSANGAGGYGTVFELSPSLVDTATQLVFTQEPTDVVAGSVISPPITVAVEDSSGNVVTTDDSTVTLAIASGPTGGTLGGTLSEQAVDGIATFSDITLNTPGDYTLSASDGTLTVATSTSFTVTAAIDTAAKLAFTQEPTNVAAGSVISPPITVAVEDSSGNVVTTDDSTVTLVIASGPAGAILGGTLSEQAVDGIATFSDITLDTPGRYTLRASDGTLTGAISTRFRVTSAASTPPPTPTTGLTTLVTFDGTNGTQPDAGLIADAAGNLYGTTTYGGANNDGTVFELAAGSYALTTLVSFNGADGAIPEAGLFMDAAGNLYGTTYSGGTNGDGTVFEVAAGTYALSTLVNFNGTNGANPQAGLAADAAGNLYGTTRLGGTYYQGTVFEVAAGTHALTTLVSFNGTDGANPEAGLIVDAAGNLYGTTAYGGMGYINVDFTGYGTVFEVAAKTHALSTLVSFNQTDGANPEATLLAGAAGVLYGTTVYGGATDEGTVFEPGGGNARSDDLGFVRLHRKWTMAHVRPDR